LFIQKICLSLQPNQTFKRLVKEKNDPTLMTEEEFFAKIERAEKQQGKSFASVDELDKYIRSL